MSDAEKAAEEYAQSLTRVEPARFTRSDIELAFYSGAAWAAPKWISVKERLPEEERDVVLYGSRGIFFGWLSSEESESPKFCSFDSEIYGVTHWMPLPDAPKEEK